MNARHPMTPRYTGGALSLVTALAVAACGGAQVDAGALDANSGVVEDDAPPAHVDHAEHAEHAEHASHADPAHRHYFDEPERFAERWNASERDEWQQPEVVLELASVAPGMTVADLGAGTGYFIPHLSVAVGPEGRVLALDAESAMVEYLESRAVEESWDNVEVRTVPYASPELAPGSVDRIFVVNTWHHIESRPTYGRELFEALRPGGELVIVDFTLDAPHGPPPAMRLSIATVVGELTEIGFEPFVAAEDLGRQYVVRGVRPAAE